MKNISMITSAAALSVLQKRDPIVFERTFQHLTGLSLKRLDEELLYETKVQNEILFLLSVDQNQNQVFEHQINDIFTPSQSDEDEIIQSCQLVLAKAVIRRLVHKCIGKYSEVSSPESVEEALKYHILPKSLREELVAKYGGGTPPQTWYDALSQLKQIVNDKLSPGEDNQIMLWELLLDHPMTQYVPVQCQSCGHVVPDDLRSDLSDADVGLQEEEPTPEEAPLVRTGWFRGPRHEAKVFLLTCPKCGKVSRWFRSKDPKIILNPNKWGRLCGEQEDLKLDLANYLGISIRTILPIDWDHLWSEFQSNDPPDDSKEGGWIVVDENARNFAVRLDEGIRSWTAVLAISPNPELCEDVTDQYLRCQHDGGRADNNFTDEMPRFREAVERARKDDSGCLTQAGTVNGYVINRAGMKSSDITYEMRQAAKVYRSKPWFQDLLDKTV